MEEINEMFDVSGKMQNDIIKRFISLTILVKVELE